jgi:hypothetical protein
MVMNDGDIPAATGGLADSFDWATAASAPQISPGDPEWIDFGGFGSGTRTLGTGQVGAPSGGLPNTLINGLAAKPLTSGSMDALSLTSHRLGGLTDLLFGAMQSNSMSTPTRIDQGSAGLLGGAVGYRGGLLPDPSGYPTQPDAQAQGYLDQGDPSYPQKSDGSGADSGSPGPTSLPLGIRYSLVDGVPTFSDGSIYEPPRTFGNQNDIPIPPTIASLDNDAVHDFVTLRKQGWSEADATYAVIPYDEAAADMSPYIREFGSEVANKYLTPSHKDWTEEQAPETVMPYDEIKALDEAGKMPAFLAPVVLKYPSGDPVIDPLTNAPYPQPPPLDMKRNVAFGESIKGHWDAGPAIIEQVVQGQPMDYQRPLGLLGVAAKTPGWFVYHFTNVTAYNLGVVAAAAGFDLDTTLRMSGRYNIRHGNARNADTAYGLTSDRVKSITQGYDDYLGGKWKQ